MPSGLTSWIWTESLGEGPVSIDRCEDIGNPAPTWAEQAGSVYVTFQPALRPEDREQTAQVTTQVEGLTAQVTAQVLSFCRTPRPASEIMDLLVLKHWKSFQKNYLRPMLEGGILERTIPDKPTSSKQKYQLGPQGRTLMETIEAGRS